MNTTTAKPGISVDVARYRRWGILFRPGSLWIGVHYAANHKRACINLLPCVTIWIIGEGGDAP